MDLTSFRQNYSKGELLENTVNPHPVEQFKIWLNQAIEAKMYEPNAMTLSTIHGNRVSSRIVLLKKIGEGFTFFSNYHSKKGKDLHENPQASLLFYWPEMERQVRIEGMIVKIAQFDSEKYFHSRPIASQIGAIVSQQSSLINSRKELEEEFESLKNKYEGKTIPKPDHWGGYELIPNYFEFWQGRRSRLHDRIAYEKIKGEWDIHRLAP